MPRLPNPTLPQIIFATVLALVTTDAAAQQRTLYGADGRVIARESTDTQGTRTLYGSDGKAVSRESKGVIYDGDGRVIGRITKDKR